MSFSEGRRILGGQRVFMYKYCLHLEFQFCHGACGGCDMLKVPVRALCLEYSLQLNT